MSKTLKLVLKRKWWDMIGKADAILFLRGRIKFIDPSGKEMGSIPSAVHSLPTAQKTPEYLNVAG